MAKVPCHLCGEELSTQATDVSQWTAGWVQNREGGGGHSVMLPQRAPLWAHRLCVDRVTKGFDRQLEMLGSDPQPPNRPPTEVTLTHDQCALCGRSPAPFGVGVFREKEHLGKWYCRDCWPKT